MSGHTNYTRFRKKRPAGSLSEQVEQEVTIIDMLADELHRYISEIYHDPFRVIKSFTDARSRGDIGEDYWAITVECDKMWSHSREEQTSNRFGRITIDQEEISPRWMPKSGTSFSMDFPLVDPNCFNKVLDVFHMGITNRLLAIADKMHRNGTLCRSNIYGVRIAKIREAITIIDKRYLRVVTREGLRNSTCQACLTDEEFGPRYYDREEYENNNLL